MTPFDVKLNFHPVARWVINGDVVQAAHGLAGSTNSSVVPQPFQLTYGVKQHLVHAMEVRHHGPRWLYVITTTTTTTYTVFVLSLIHI